MRPVNITSSRAKEYYYERDPIFNEDGGNQNSTWIGKGSNALGLRGGVKPEDFENIVDGRSPEGEQLVRAGGKEQKHRAGTDLPFSAPKSVSVQALVGGDERLIKAQQAAVEAAAKFIEKHYIYHRSTFNGRTKIIQGDNIVASAFMHSTSRANDPQLHTHLIIMNMTKVGDQWRALENSAIFRDQRLLTQVYLNELAQRVKELGYGIEQRANGTWEISGFDQKLLDQFSKRSEQINNREKELRDEGELHKDGLINKVATLDSRPDKDIEITKEQLEEKWRGELDLHQISMPGSQDLEKAAAKAVGGTVLSARNYVMAAAEQITETESVFTEADLKRQALAYAHGSGVTVREVEQAVIRLKSSGKLRELASNDNGMVSLTTKEMQRIERRIIDSARISRRSWLESVDSFRAQAFLSDYEKKKGMTLTKGQRRAAAMILSSRDQVNTIQGNAGTGKTAVMGALVEFARDNDYNIIGVAATGKAARELADVGVHAKTIDGFLSTAAQKDNIEKKLAAVYTKKSYLKQAGRKIDVADLAKFIVDVEARGRLRFDADRFSIKPRSKIKVDVHRLASVLRRAGYKFDTDSLLEKVAKLEVRKGLNPETMQTGMVLNSRSIVIVDESSMAGSRQVQEIQRRVLAAGGKVVFSGDIKQFASISAGQIFAELQSKSMVDHIEMNEVMRQKTEETRELVSELNRRDEHDRILTEDNVEAAFSALERRENLIEIKSHESRVAFIIGQYMSQSVDGKTAVLTSTNATRQELNARIREQRVSAGQIDEGQAFKTLIPLNMSAQQAKHADAYREGVSIVLMDHTRNFLRGDHVVVTGVDRSRNQIHVVNQDGKKGIIDTMKESPKFAAYEQTERHFSQGDRVIFLKNDRKIGIQNGVTGEVVGVSRAGKMRVRTDTGKVIALSMNRYQYIDHAYALTDMKAQGASIKNTIALTETSTPGAERRNTFNSFYVQATRATHRFTLVTDDKTALKEQVKSLDEKTSTLGFSPSGGKQAARRDEKELAQDLALAQEKTGRQIGERALAFSVIRYQMDTGKKLNLRRLVREMRHVGQLIDEKELRKELKQAEAKLGVKEVSLGEIWGRLEQSFREEMSGKQLQAARREAEKGDREIAR